MQKSWYILGSGAIGTLWAAKFSKASIDCVLLHRRQTSLYQNELLSLTQVDGSQVHLPIQQLTLDQLSKNHLSLNKPSSKKPSIDKLLVCTKSYQTQAALQNIAPLLSPDANIVLLQNGMGQHEQVASLLPTQTIIAASTTEGAMLEASLKVRHTGLGISQFNSYDLSKKMNTDVLKELIKIGMTQHPNIQSVLWNKLTINCVINPLTAIFNCRNGELIKNNEYLAQVKALSKEVDLIAKCLALSIDDPNTFEQVLTVAKATSNNYSSMHQDIKFKRKTEIEFINGYLQYQAEVHNIPLTLNSSVLERIKTLEMT
jgi:2-dehydropantoate 2-reductase